MYIQQGKDFLNQQETGINKCGLVINNYCHFDGQKSILKIKYICDITKY